MLEKQHMKKTKIITWTGKVIDTICDRIADGVAVSQFAGKDGIPSARSIYRKMASEPEFARRIVIEREAAQESEMQNCIALADSATPENWQVVKLQIWARQWYAARMLPKRWGSAPDVVVQNNNVAHAQVVTLSDDQDHALQELIASVRNKVSSEMPSKRS
jgi:hypothetical protein